MLDKAKLRNAYRKYGFEEQISSDNNVAVFSIRTGHYHNADIVPLIKDYNVDDIFDQYKRLSYACQTKEYSSIENVEQELFNGFFSIKSTQERLLKEYNQFTNSLVKIHSDNATYSFINTKYHINNKLGELSVVDEIMNRLDTSKPTLFLVEAAAGFGKTCSAYELVKEIVKSSISKVPLFSELSRNRQAKIFRYVLLDEIDRSFPLLSSALVRSEIRSGNVPVILDGFDELLHETSSDDSSNYDSTEPMLETISELLTDQAKVVLTTRRTAIFDGDEFHQWISAHENDFDIVRIRLHEPSLEDWLPQSRLSRLEECNLPLGNLSNPVLLSFLRCISDSEFDDVTNDTSSLVDKYFNSMLERERKRQDLLMSPREQYSVLLSIADDMIRFDYTSESRDYIYSLISDKHQLELEKIRMLYPSDIRPTPDELVNKLCSHALLDRNTSDENQGIGFVNEFVLGSLCADSIINDKSMEWDGDKRFIEPAIQAYIARSDDDKEILWESLRFVLEFMSGHDKILYNFLLTGELRMDLDGENVEDLVIRGIKLGRDAKISTVAFINCQFTEVEFDFAAITNSTFIGCSFYNCRTTNDQELEEVYFVGCDDNNDLIASISHEEIPPKDDHGLDDCDIFVLEKFCPKGSQTFYKHRAIGSICAVNNQFNHYDIMQSVKKLKKQNYLLVPDKRSFLELNLEYVADVKSILGRA
ncbi:hypothetical protein [Vibrio campbellii]|uniref:hypothetical protein n=3 Tax=Vibrio campbellii TaxID=680 RepID=UPI00249A6B63|nr:hypothetical protein [Vibrio campbellii]